MPFGSRTNNFAATLAIAFIVASVIASVIGMVISNRDVVRTTHSNQATIIKQNEQLISEHAEMLLILRSLERRYLDGTKK